MHQTLTAAKAVQKGAQRRVRSRLTLPVPADHQVDVVAHAQFLRPLDFRFDVGERRTDQAPGSRRFIFPSRSRGRSGNLRASRGLHNQRARSNQAGQFRVAEFLKQRPDIPIDRLLPNILPRSEITAHRRPHGCACRQRQHTAPAGRPPRIQNADRLGGSVAGEPVHRRQHSLNFVSDDVPPDFISHAVDVLAMSQVGEHD